MLVAGLVSEKSTRAIADFIGNNGWHMVAYELHRQGPQEDPSRDIVGLRAVVYGANSSYVNFITIVSPASDVRPLLPDVNRERLYDLQTQLAIPHISAALASKRLPLADPTAAFEVRIPASAVSALHKSDAGLVGQPEPLTFEVQAPIAYADLDLTGKWHRLVRPRRLHVRNLLSFDGDGSGIDIDSLTVLVGPNGAGKSNLVTSFRLLRDLLTRSLHSSQRHRPFGSKPVGFDLDFDVIGIAGQYTVDFELSDGTALILNESLHLGGEPVLTRTSSRDVVYQSVENLAPGIPGIADIAHLIASDTTALGMLGREAISPVVGGLRHMIDGISIQSMFLRRSDVNGFGGNQNFLNGDGSNVIGVITRLLAAGTTRDLLVSRFADAVGSGADLRLVGASWVAVLNNQEFRYEELSTGTQRWLQLMAMVIDPLRPALLLIDEPENGLHPDLLFRFATHAAEAARISPIVLCTHSTNLLDHLHLAGMERSVRVVENLGGSTTIRSIESELELEDVKEMLLGTAWASGLLGGNPS